MRPSRISTKTAFAVAILAFHSVVASISSIVFTVVPTDVVAVRFNLYTLTLAIGMACAYMLFRVLVPEDAVIIIDNRPPGGDP